MIDPQQVHHRRLQVVDVDAIACNVIAKLTCLPVNQTRFDTAASHPHCKTSWMVVATEIGLDFSLAIVRPPKLPTPDHECIVQ